MTSSGAAGRGRGSRRAAPQRAIREGVVHEAANPALTNEVADADAIMAQCQAEARAQARTAMLKTEATAGSKLAEAERIATTTNADYARIQALREQVIAKNTAAQAAPICQEIGPNGAPLKQPKCLPAKGTTLSPEQFAQLEALKAIEAKAKSLTDRVNKQLDNGKTFLADIRTAARTVSDQSATTRGSAVRALAAEGRSITTTNRAAAIAKLGSARTQYFAFEADITQDIKVQTSRNQSSLDQMVTPMAQNQNEVAMLKGDAERVAANEVEQPATPGPIRPLVLPGQKK